MAAVGPWAGGLRLIVGSGIDVIEIARIDRALERSGERFERRVFARAEIEACRARRRPAPHYAIRFAAKEAVMKALGTGWARGVRWVDIETVPGAGAGPAQLSLALHGRVAELVGSSHAHLTVSHTRSHAVALVLLESNGP